MTDWNKSKVVDLKAELKRRGLPQTGLKPQLVARLAAAEDEEAAESKPAAPEDAPKDDLSSATAPDDEPVPKPRANEDVPTEPVEQPPKPQGDYDDLSRTGSPPAVAKHSPTISDSSKPPSQTDDHTSALPSVEPQEALEDRQKRKRRSLTPPISADEVARKRFRTGENNETLADVDVTMSNDPALVERRSGELEDGVDTASRNSAPTLSKGEPSPAIIGRGKGEDAAEGVTDGQHPASDLDAESTSRPRDSRFKGLFEAPQPSSAIEESSRDSGLELEDEPDHVVEPAIHPATSALYIRDFMRPLNQLSNSSRISLP